MALARNGLALQANAAALARYGIEAQLYVAIRIGEYGWHGRNECTQYSFYCIWCGKYLGNICFQDDH